MKLEKLGAVNLIWFLISLFLMFWLGHQLFGAIQTQEIQNLRVTDTVSLSNTPIWFAVVYLVKFLAWLISVGVAVLYIKRRAKVT
ncbi:hypothetical protein [Alteromonas sp. OM2203]|uniref:hypothetical protein n=1 Tax=Alteromonas sp. OM2203 TaxID=3398817 RepID=UPI003AF3A704